MGPARKNAIPNNRPESGKPAADCPLEPAKKPTGMETAVAEVPLTQPTRLPVIQPPISYAATPDLGKIVRAATCDLMNSTLPELPGCRAAGSVVTALRPSSGTTPLSQDAVTPDQLIAARRGSTISPDTKIYNPVADLSVGVDVRTIVRGIAPKAEAGLPRSVDVQIFGGPNGGGIAVTSPLFEAPAAIEGSPTTALTED